MKNLIESIVLPPLALCLLIVLVAWVSWQVAVEEESD